MEIRNSKLLLGIDPMIYVTSHVSQLVKASNGEPQMLRSKFTVKGWVYRLWNAAIYIHIIHAQQQETWQTLPLPL
jgi:hypothetical protein